MIATNVFALLQYVPWACMSLALAQRVWKLADKILVFSAMRALALTQNRPLASLILILYLTTPGINLVRPDFGLMYTLLVLITSGSSLCSLLVSPALKTRSSVVQK